ncbi:MAG: peptidylprolyl isomerase [Bacilli bacterium]|nr:peptidylprolyl isomerase [Bacilli bacterium]
MKKILLIIVACFMLAGCNSKKDELLSGYHYVEIDIKDYGVITAKLNADIAPITVTNFINLANEGFYDGLTFHRIIDGFMMQGGDPKHDGTGGSEQTIKGEFKQNGVYNGLSHIKGALSMARSEDMDSASSQFFIVQEDSLHLDGSYAVFGYVTEGIEIVDKICADAKPIDNNGTIKYENQPIINSIKVIKKDE